MRAFTWMVLLVVALSSVLVFAGLVGKETDVSYRLLPATCAISLIGVPLFLLLAARQSRKDREERERRQMRQFRFENVSVERGGRLFYDPVSGRYSSEKSGD